MSKPLNKELLSEFNAELVDRKNEILLQVLDFLEILNAKDEKMLRISSELTELLENEENLAKITNASNLEELLNVLSNLNENKMLKVYENAYLEEKFPTLARNKFLN